MKAKVLCMLAVILAVLFAVPVCVSAVEIQGESTYINVNEAEYWTLKPGADPEGESMDWGFYEAEGQYGGVQLYAYGYPQEMEEPEAGYVMPTATLAFKGTYVGVISIPGPDQGWMDIYLDGIYQTTIRSTLEDAEDSEPVWEDVNSVLLWSADGLEDSVHTVTVLPTAKINWEEEITWSKCNVDAIVIKGEPVKAAEVTVPELKDPEPTEKPVTTAPATTAPVPTLPVTTAPAATTSVPTETTVGSTQGSDGTNPNEGSPFVWIAIAAVAVIAVGAVVFFIVKKKKA